MNVDNAVSKERSDFIHFLHLHPAPASASAFVVGISDGFTSVVARGPSLFRVPPFPFEL
jgi:hypothetical protein